MTTWSSAEMVGLKDCSMTSVLAWTEQSCFYFSCWGPFLCHTVVPLTAVYHEAVPRLTILHQDLWKCLLVWDEGLLHLKYPLQTAQKQEQYEIKNVWKYNWTADSIVICKEIQTFTGNLYIYIPAWHQHD